MEPRRKAGKEVRSRSFAMRVNEKERQMLAKLARSLQRSRSDAVRLLVREALDELEPSEEEGQDDKA